LRRNLGQRYCGSAVLRPYGIPRSFTVLLGSRFTGSCSHFCSELKGLELTFSCEYCRSCNPSIPLADGCSYLWIDYIKHPSGSGLAPPVIPFEWWIEYLVIQSRRRWRDIRGVLERSPGLFSKFTGHPGHTDHWNQ
jgi:hypothetical protein